MNWQISVGTKFKLFLGIIAIGTTISCGKSDSQESGLSDDSRNSTPAIAKQFASELLEDINRETPGGMPFGSKTIRQVYVDPTFSAEQKSTIKAAMAILEARGWNDEMLKCATNASNKDFPNFSMTWRTLALTGEHRWKFQRTGATSVGLAFVGKPAKIYISRIWNDGIALARGWLNILPHSEDGIEFSIALNSDFMVPPYSSHKDPEFWAGVIAHEQLHNLGLNHPTGYTGSYMYEFGNCIRFNGQVSNLAEEVIPAGMLPMPTEF